MKNPSARTFGAVCLALAVIAGTATSASAQNALGDGQVLDRNLQQGSGGRNTSVRDLNALIRYNNAVVTGNAYGGKSFQGNAGYLATDDFRGALGSDQLFRFRRESAVSAAVIATGIRGTDALQYQFALSTGQRPPDVLGNIPDFSTGLSRGANPIHPGFPSINTRVSGSTASAALRSTADYNAQQALRPSVLGYTVLKDGRQSVLTASPLLGVGAVTMGQAAGQTPIPADGANGTNSAARPPSNVPALSGLESVPSYVAKPMSLANTIAPTRLETRVDTPRMVMDSLSRALNDDKNKDETPEPRTPQPLDPATNPAEPGSKSMLQRELDRIRDTLSGRAPTEPLIPTPAIPTPPTDPQPAPQDPNNQTPSPTSASKLFDPVTGKIDKDVLRALQETRPTVTRFTPETTKEVNTYAAHMGRGEALLADAKYIDAEDAFIRALALQPSDPFAGIGRVHAQLGAGFFLSASANLRSFFNDRPEMIGTRYAPGLFPSATRCKTIAAQLRSSMADPVSAIAKESAMLLAYIGYQKNDKEMLKDGVKRMSELVTADHPADQLLVELLQKIWIEGKDPAPGAPAPAPATPAPATPAPKADDNK